MSFKYILTVLFVEEDERGDVDAIELLVSIGDDDYTSGFIKETLHAVVHVFGGFDDAFWIDVVVDEHVDGCHLMFFEARRGKHRAVLGWLRGGGHWSWATETVGWCRAGGMAKAG